MKEEKKAKKNQTTQNGTPRTLMFSVGGVYMRKWVLTEYYSGGPIFGQQGPTCGNWPPRLFNKKLAANKTGITRHIPGQKKKRQIWNNFLLFLNF